jgi:hypothetical protein
MKKLFVDDCPACEPVNRLIHDLKKHKFRLIEQRLEDYHFLQLYFKLKGDITAIEKISVEGFTKKDHQFICDCHWSTIEIISIAI